VIQAERAALWAAYQADRSIANRNRLVQVYWFQARAAARRAARADRSLDACELESLAAEALILAVERSPDVGESHCRKFILGRLGKVIRGGVANQHRRRERGPIYDTRRVERYVERESIR